MSSMSIVAFLVALCFMTLMLDNVCSSDVHTFVSGFQKPAVLKCDLPKSDPPVIFWESTAVARGPGFDIVYSKDLQNDPLNIFSFNEDNFEMTIEWNKDGDANGEYRCRSEKDGETFNVTYNLIQLKGELNCTGKTDLFEGEMFNLDCSVGTANELKFSFDYKNYSSESSDTFDESIRKLSFKAEPNDNNQQITCSILPNGPQCNFALNVTYKVRDVVMPENTTYEVGETLECKASGNPVPEAKLFWQHTGEVEWKQVATSSTGQAELHLNESHVGNVTVMCRFNNKFGEQDKTVNLKVVEQTSVLQTLASKLKENNYLLLIVIIVIALVILLLIIGLIIYKRKKSNDKKDSKAGVALLKSEPRKDYKNESV